MLYLLPPATAKSMLDQFSTVFDGYTQTTRLLRLTTPLGSEQLLAESVHGEEGISEGYTFIISALSLDANISLRSLLGQPALLELLTVETGAPRSFHGYLTAVEFNGANGGMARYTLTLQPWSAFLGRTRDSRVFQDMTVLDILDSVFRTWQGRSKLAPVWRFDVADRSGYAVRSLATQYQESDLAFVERLMSEEGLFYFFEHEGDSDNPSFGKHEMVIADHNGAFRPNVQPCARYTQPGAVMKEDSIDRWRCELRLQTNAVELQSWDYRTLDTRPVSSAGVRPSGPDLVSRDVPGQYAYPTRQSGQRIADRQMQAIEARREVFTGAGTVRTLAPATTFTLEGHAVHDLEDDDARTFVVTRVVHLMNNNLSADIKADIVKRLGHATVGAEAAGHDLLSVPQTERPLYRNRIEAIRSAVPYRAIRTDDHGRLLHPRPTVRGQQTAVVVGPPGSVIHTDRDHRVKIQFHWQRAAGEEMSHNRLAHPYPEGHIGAPGDDRAGTWVRVATPLAPVAGANWGSHALPRVGQEVLVDFLEGDIDRPVIIGALYNGLGELDAQHNKVSQGAGVATGNAPAWFPGEEGAHGHAAVLSGFKSQAMQSSQNGAGAYSQLVFDDSAGQSRIALQRHESAHKGTAELNLGHLRHQADNQRLQPAGFGAELKTEHSLAVRAGQGMLLSADRRNGASGGQMDAREAQEQISASFQLQTTLAESAKKHNAELKPQPGVAPQPGGLPAIGQMRRSSVVVGEAAVTADKQSANGEPHLQLSSPAGILATTPANAVLSSSVSSNLSGGHDVDLVAQSNAVNTVAGGISLFTYGKVSNKEKPGQEAGIRLHAASGQVSCQSQSGEIKFVADKAVTVASIAKSVAVGAPKKHLLLTAQGAYIKLEGGNIEVHCPGRVNFKASMKELAGPSSVPDVATAHKVHELNIKRDMKIEYVDADGNPLTGEPINLRFSGELSKTANLDSSGTAIVSDAPLGPLRAEQPVRRKVLP